MYLKNNLLSTASIWNISFLVLVSLPNIISLYYDPTSTKVAGLLVSVLLVVGVSRCFSDYRTLIIFSIPLLLFSFISLSVLLQFNSHVTEGVIDAVIKSDAVEAFEFFSSIRFGVYVLAIIYIVAFYFLYLTAKKIQLNNKKKTWITILLIILPFVDLLGKGASSISYPLILVNNIYMYYNEKNKENDLMKSRKNFTFNAKLKDSKKKETYILVIGETSRRDYYSLYGYPRNTNPKLSQLKNMTIYKDAISPSNATVLSLMATLHLATAKNYDRYHETKSIVSLAKEAGYKTSWLSTQSRFGKHETGISSSGIEAGYKKFVVSGRTLKRSYDDSLLPHLESVLSHRANKNFVVMHFYGSHISYGKRYPDEFNVFEGSTPPFYEGRSRKIKKTINEYTNSILFTDHVLDRVITKMKETNEVGCVVYTADHGEYLADYPEDVFIGHGRGVPYKVEVEVPLLAWCSKQFVSTYPNKWKAMNMNKNKQINIEDMFYSLSDLMRIDYSLMDNERSFFNEQFVPVLPRTTRGSSSKQLHKYNDLK